MRTGRFGITASLLLVMGVALAACAPIAEPTSTPTVEPSPTPTEEPTPEPTPTATAVPTETLTPEATATPSPEPGADWLPAGTVALHAKRVDGELGLYALLTDGSTADMDRGIQGVATVSNSGRWIAYRPDVEETPGELTIESLADDTVYTVSATEGFTIYEWIFGRDEERLAFVEVGPPGEETDWAVVVVSLEDGSTTRFATSSVGGPAGGRLPGRPLGWTASGEGLLMDTFVPYTEGAYQGIWKVAIPKGTPAQDYDELVRSQLVAADAYQNQPMLSPEGELVAYLSRDQEYEPEDYEPIAYDMAVNQLWTVDPEDRETSMLVEVTDGGALGLEIAWSPSGDRVLFAEGMYAGDRFGSLTLKTVDRTGAEAEVGEVPLPEEGGFSELHWVSPDKALFVVRAGEALTFELYEIQIESGETNLVDSAEYLLILGSVRGE